VLRGYDDDAASAQACALEYHRVVLRHLAGERGQMPVSHPLGSHPLQLDEAHRSPARAPRRRQHTEQSVPQQIALPLDP
jgi:hypothetical protein